MCGTMTLTAVQLHKHIEIMKTCATVRGGIGAVVKIQYPEAIENGYLLADEIVNCLLDRKRENKKPRTSVCKNLHRFYEKELLEREPDLRLGILKRMVFALETFTDDDMLAAFELSGNFTDIYEDLGSAEEEYEIFYEEAVQRDHLLTLIEQLHLSDASVRYLARHLAEGQFYISNAGMLGYECFLRRSAVALHLCLTEGLTVAEAVGKACKLVQLELYPEEELASAVSGAFVALGVLVTLLFTKYFFYAYDLSFLWAEFFGICTGLLLYSVGMDYKEKVTEWCSLAMIWLRERLQGAKAEKQK